MIINLTQHPATPEQKLQGLVDLQGNELILLKDLLTFDEIPTPNEIADRARLISNLAISNNLGSYIESDEDPLFLRAMIGGAPFLMSALESALRAINVSPVYAFSKRISEESLDREGNVTKVNVFRHVGFIDYSARKLKAL